MAVTKTKDFDNTVGLLQAAEKTVLNNWVAKINGGQDLFAAAKAESKYITKLAGKPAVAKGGTHELQVGAVNRVFFSYTSGTDVLLTNIGHT